MLFRIQLNEIKEENENYFYLIYILSHINNILTIFNGFPINYNNNIIMFGTPYITIAILIIGSLVLSSIITIR